ncbi:NAD-dependent epimerase/dehydratase family protein [Paucibacter soli]|uniref:NAD-dependent epimerase/dehydratase family protein n=1 Tax=Paucibacter soli TaxID=3133433 RepID=UPI00309B9DC5
MTQYVLVIGGTRYFGIRLVEALLAAGHRVTLANRGQTPDTFGSRVQRLRVDRRDAAAMAACFAERPGFDLVYDQMCYSAADAAIAAQVFGGRVGRYLMTSTIEVYGGLHGRDPAPYAEDALDLTDELGSAAAEYGQAKLQAEAQLYRAGSLPAASLRLAHVLGGPEDFTQRLASHVRAVLAAEPLRHAAAAGQSSFIDVAGVGDFMLWAGQQSFLGPVNVASEGGLSAPELRARIGLRLGLPAPCQAQAQPGAASFDYAAPHRMSLARARRLGWEFRPLHAWLDGLIALHAQDLRHAAA